jgi:Cysteine dioxygenase type I
MALAYPDPTADRTSSPPSSDHLTAGSGAPSPARPGGSAVPRSRRVDLAALAQCFTPSAAGIHELRGVAERSWILLAVTDLFEAWAIGWPPGGRIDLHDHGPSNGAVALAVGSLTETSIRVSRQGTAVISTRRIRAGQHREFTAGDVHDLNNDGGREAVSVHVYGPRLSSMTYYELDHQGRLVVARSEAVAPVGPFDTTGDHDPS